MNIAQNGTEGYTKHTNEEDWLGYVSRVVCYLFRLFLLKERLEENEGWQLCCQVIPNLLIRTSPVQVLGVSHNMVVDLPLKGLQVILWEHRAGKRIPFPE